MTKLIPTLGLALSLLSQAALAFAEDSTWHWDQFGTSSYSGSINLRDDTGNVFSYQRYGSGATPSVFGSSSVQSPVLVIAGGGANVQVDTVASGVAIPKITCKAGETLEFHGSITGACNNGTASNMQGIYITAGQNATHLFPYVWIYVEGAGWTQVWGGHACGMVMAVQQCRK